MAAPSSAARRCSRSRLEGFSWGNRAVLGRLVERAAVWMGLGAVGAAGALATFALLVGTDPCSGARRSGRSGSRRRSSAGAGSRCCGRSSRTGPGPTSTAASSILLSRASGSGRRLRARRDRALGLRAGRRRRARARLGAAREGGAGVGRLGADRAARLADRVLERARDAAGFRAAAGALARRSARAPALAARRRGVVYTYALVVAILLTYSRGGVLAAAIAVAAWLVIGGPRIEGAAALLLGGGAGLGVAVWAFSRPGLAQDSRRTRRACATAPGSRSSSSWRGRGRGARVPRLARRGGEAAGRSSPALVGRAALGVLARGRRGRGDRAGGRVEAAGLVPRLHPAGDEHLGDRRARPADDDQLDEPLAVVEGGLARVRGPAAQGSGAGSFELAHRLFRDEQRRRHRAAQRAVAVPERDRRRRVPARARVGRGGRRRGDARVSRARRARSARWRPRYRRRALACLLHSLVDFDWDFVALCAPFLLTVGVLLGGGRTVRPPALDAGAGAGRVGARGRVLAADALVRGTRDRLGARRARGRAARRRGRATRTRRGRSTRSRSSRCSSRPGPRNSSATSRAARALYTRRSTASRSTGARGTSSVSSRSGSATTAPRSRRSSVPWSSTATASSRRRCCSSSRRS